MANFNSISPFYDGLERLVFGDTLNRATRYFLGTLSPNDKILILGGGNGHILSWLDELNIPLGVTYVENAAKMMEASRRKGPFSTIKVDFVMEDAKLFVSDRIFDVVLTPFFLDCFSDAELARHGTRWTGMLRKGGCWIFTDFVNGSKYQFMIPLMYGFFRIAARLQTSKLPRYSILFDPEVFRLEGELTYYSGLIATRHYKKL